LLLRNIFVSFVSSPILLHKNGETFSFTTADGDYEYKYDYHYHEYY